MPPGHTPCLPPHGVLHVCPRWMRPRSPIRLGVVTVAVRRTTLLAPPPRASPFGARTRRRTNSLEMTPDSRGTVTQMMFAVGKGFTLLEGWA